MGLDSQLTALLSDLPVGSTITDSGSPRGELRLFIAGGSFFFTVNLAKRHLTRSKAMGFARAQPILALHCKARSCYHYIE
jgi:hypothetical protein